MKNLNDIMDEIYGNDSFLGGIFIWAGHFAMVLSWPIAFLVWFVILFLYYCLLPIKFVISNFFKND